MVLDAHEMEVARTWGVLGCGIVENYPHHRYYCQFSSFLIQNCKEIPGDYASNPRSTLDVGIRDGIRSGKPFEVSSIYGDASERDNRCYHRRPRAQRPFLVFSSPV